MAIGLEMVNGPSIAHDGLMCSPADTGFTCAYNSWGPPTVAAGADIVFLAAARGGDVLDACAQIRTSYGRYGISVRRDDDVMCEFRGRSHQLPECRA
ncbi:MAG: acyl-CoA thioesterase [Pseudonocardiales bacterium]|nr:acyl-CoA thioesterase [Pseudonocardiales bacterium]